MRRPAKWAVSCILLHAAVLMIPMVRYGYGFSDTLALLFTTEVYVAERSV